MHENIYLSGVFILNALKRSLPNLLWLVFLGSKDLSSGSIVSPGSSPETVSMAPLWQLPGLLLSAFSPAILAGKAVSHVLTLTNHWLAMIGQHKHKHTHHTHTNWMSEDYLSLDFIKGFSCLYKALFIEALFIWINALLKVNWFVPCENILIGFAWSILGFDS